MRNLCLGLVAALLLTGLALPATADDGAATAGSYVDALVEAVIALLLPSENGEEPDPGDDEAGIMIEPAG